MLVPDLNVLIYAFRRDARDHLRYRAWLMDLVNGSAAYGLSDAVLASVVRVTTNPRIYARPSELEEALGFVEALRSPPHAAVIREGTRHWGIFTGLCRATEAKGGLVQDAYFAALAIESGSEWITTDRDFARFPRLRWRHPLQGS